MTTENIANQMSGFYMKRNTRMHSKPTNLVRENQNGKTT